MQLSLYLFIVADELTAATENAVLTVHSQHDWISDRAKPSIWC